DLLSDTYGRAQLLKQQQKQLKAIEREETTGRRPTTNSNQRKRPKTSPTKRNLNPITQQPCRAISQLGRRRGIMTNYNLEEFKTWLNENESRKEKISKEVQHVAGRHRGKKYLDCFFDNQKKQITEQKDNEIKHIKQTLSEKSLQLTNTLKSLSDLQSENKTLKQTNQDQKQRILALEADKSDLLKTLNQQKEKHQTHLNKQKQQLTKQITLIKEALNK
ncbi:17702_t:CDS:2, partial [Racocetra persica]